MPCRSRSAQLGQYWLLVVVAIFLLFSANAHCRSPNSVGEGLLNAAGLTEHFRAWLAERDYQSHGFARSDLGLNGSFGGRTQAGEMVARQPVIFIHGNSDHALGAYPLGWNRQIQYFLKHGYRKSELYATTWGPADAKLAAEQYHAKPYVTKVRAFIEAVLEYTGAEQVDVVGHSMGVTLARRAILGGKGFDKTYGDYDLGRPLTARVDTFVGIAGANQGLVICAAASVVPSCDKTSGFFPGGWRWGWPIPQSTFLAQLNADPRREGQFIYSIWSPTDEVVGFGNLVFGKITGRIPQQDDEIVILGPKGSHFDLKNTTAEQVLNLVVHHRIDDG